MLNLKYNYHFKISLSSYAISTVSVVSYSFYSIISITCVNSVYIYSVNNYSSTKSYYSFVSFTSLILSLLNPFLFSSSLLTPNLNIASNWIINEDPLKIQILIYITRSNVEVIFTTAAAKVEAILEPMVLLDVGIPDTIEINGWGIA